MVRRRANSGASAGAEEFAPGKPEGGVGSRVLTWFVMLARCLYRKGGARSAKIEPSASTAIRRTATPFFSLAKPPAGSVSLGFNLGNDRVRQREGLGYRIRSGCARRK